MKFVAISLLTLLLALSAHAQTPYSLPDGLYSEVTTAKGVVVGELFYKKVPVTIAHYVGLAEGTIGPRKGTPFFDGARFIRVDFVIQTGETRLRIPGFPDEMVPGLRHDGMGVMQMSNSGPDTNGSYWCYMLEETARLNYLHTVFGRVVRGMDVLPQIRLDDTIKTLKILRVGPDVQNYKVDEESFAALVAKAKKYEGPGEPGPDAFFDDPDKIFPQGGRYTRARDFNFKLAKFALFTSRLVKGRVFAKVPADLEDPAKLNAYMDALAGKLGMADAGALAVYFVDKDRWEIRIGKESQASFIAGPRKADGTKDPVAKDKTLDQATAEFLAAAHKTSDEYIAKEEKAAPAGQPVAAGQKIKLKVDAMLDGLIFRLEPAGI